MLTKILSVLGARRPSGRDDRHSREASRPSVDDVIDAAKALSCADALALVETACEHAPADPRLLSLRASILRRWGRFQEAFDLAEVVATEHAESSDAQTELGFAAVHVGRFDVAERAMATAARAAPQSFESSFNLAYVHYVAGHREEAERLYGECVGLRPGDFEALIGLGTCQLDRKDFAAAEATFRRCTEVNPDSPAGWSHLGICLARQGRTDEARTKLEQGVARFDATGEHPESFVNLGIFLRDEGAVTDSLRVFERYLPANPDPFVHYAYAHALQMAGRIEEAWEHYEFRWMIEPLRSMRSANPVPHWEGQSLAGKTIIVREEQGVGDAIQCVRYCEDLKAAGATVILATTPAFQPLAPWCDGIDRVLGPGDATPAYDYWVNLMSLPRILGDASVRPRMERPYISVRKDFRERWSRRLSSARGLKVGLVWGGSPSHANDAFRSIPLSRLEPLMDIDGVSFHSLQKGPHAGGLDDVAFRDRIEPLGDELLDFRDAAAAIEQLDLVITVDTSVAHLAGALGRDVWMLTARPPDSRWFATGERTDWYPTLALYRQVRWNDWREPVASAARDLRARVAAHEAAMPATAPPIDPDSPNGVHERERPHGLSRVAETPMGLVQYRPAGEPYPGIPARVTQPFEHLVSLRPLLSRGGFVLASPAGGSLAALELLQHVQPAGHLLLHEPDPVEHAMLGNSLAANRASGWSLLRNAMAAAEAAVPHGGDAASSRALDLDALRLTTLDWLVLNDVASSEATLATADRTLWRLRPRIVARCSDPEQATRLAVTLDRFAYRCWVGSRVADDVHVAQMSDAQWTIVGVAEDADVPSMPSWLSARSQVVA